MEDGAKFKGKIDMGQSPKVKLVPKETASNETAQADPVVPNKPRAVSKDR